MQWFLLVSVLEEANTGRFRIVQHLPLCYIFWRLCSASIQPRKPCRKTSPHHTILRLQSILPINKFIPQHKDIHPTDGYFSFSEHCSSCTLKLQKSPHIPLPSVFLKQNLFTVITKSHNTLLVTGANETKQLLQPAFKGETVISII